MVVVDPLQVLRTALARSRATTGDMVVALVLCLAISILGREASHHVLHDRSALRTPLMYPDRACHWNTQIIIDWLEQKHGWFCVSETHISRNGQGPEVQKWSVNLPPLLALSASHIYAMFSELRLSHISCHTVAKTCNFCSAKSVPAVQTVGLLQLYPYTSFFPIEL
jgi:hypothetical protein